MKTLDKARDYAQVFGATDGRIYEQDGVSFTADGKEWVDPSAAPRVAVKAEKPAPADKKGQQADPVSDQLAQQLKG